MAKSRRLDRGGLIDRGKPVRFRFNSRTYSGFAGDSLASALLANGVKVVGRSFKYHRPRGIFTAGEEEPCALVETGEGDARVPTCRATMVPLEEGLVATSQKGWPSVNFDFGRVFDFTHALWPAGFYNKTFMWPSWEFWEPLVRRTAGLGRPLTGPDPDHYEQVNAHCDVLVCGGGPAGLWAALTAGRAGLRVILAEQDRIFGGALNSERLRLDNRAGHDWACTAVAELAEMPKVTLLPRTTVSGIFDHNVTTLLETGRDTSWRECLWTVRPRHILLATGAIEQGLIFPGNDRPGIMLAGAVRHYLNRYAVVPGHRPLLATNNDSAYQTVFDLAREGTPVATVIDSRKAVSDELRHQLSDLGTELVTGARISGTRGARGISSVSLESVDGGDLGRRRCDLLAVSGGWAPRVHLLAHARGTLGFDTATQSFLPDRVPDGLSLAGAANGDQGLQACLQASDTAIRNVCEALGAVPGDERPPQVDEDTICAQKVGAVKLNTSKPRQWIDLAHDVTLGDAELAVREGFVSVEHFKRYTTTGMSVDQGKTGNINAFTVLGELTGRETGDVGTTTFRPPYTPVTLGAIAGRNTGEFYAPSRHLPAHAVHARLGAHFEDYGWLRPDCYPVAGESTQAAIHREAVAVRSSVGVFDNSPIGKLEVRGPDAAEFLNRFYMNNMLTLQPGHARYGLMLNENGVIIDDGVAVRLAQDHFLVHTTSAGVERIGAAMEEWLQCEWTGLKVLVDDVTTRWANFTLAGPKARKVLAALGTEIDLSADALPHMTAATGTVAGLEARVVRVSFSGELSYEINVPARHGKGFLEAVLEAGEAFEICPYGIEALMILRLEKGFVHVGSDTDGASTPDDVGWGRVARAKTTDYIGRRSLFRAANQDPDRKQLVGLEAVDPQQPLKSGGHLLLGENREPPAETDGWITSACFSPNLGRHIALGVLRGGEGREGAVLTVCDENERFHVRVVPAVFHDRDNQKLRD
jgi:sarcosine oxidase subunit alpha